jgi:excisionase family DNA binding protein
MMYTSVVQRSMPCYGAAGETAPHKECSGMGYLTVAEVAEQLRVYPGTVKRWLREGKLVGIQLGDRAGWRIAEEDLAAFVERQKNVPVGADDADVEGKEAA